VAEWVTEPEGVPHRTRGGKRGATVKGAAHFPEGTAVVEPTFADYVAVLFTLFERLWQHHAARCHRGHPLVYQHKALLVFFVVMQQRHIFHCKAQRRWLKRHPELCPVFGLDQVPHRTTLSRRSRAFYDIVPDCIAFVGQ